MFIKVLCPGLVWDIQDRGVRPDSLVFGTPYLRAFVANPTAVTPSRSKIDRSKCTISTFSIGFPWLGMTRGKFVMVFVPTHFVWAIAFSRGWLHSSGLARSPRAALPFP
jgi:hypothetical protein